MPKETKGDSVDAQNKILMAVKPNLKAVRGAYLIGFFTILFLLIVSVGLFALDMVVLKTGALSAVFFVPAILFLGMIIMQPIYAFFAYQALKNTKFDVYEDRFEYYEGFLNKVRRVIEFQYVTDIASRKSWLADRIYGTGSVIVITAGLGSLGFGAVRYVDNPDELVSRLRKSIDDFKKKNK